MQGGAWRITESDDRKTTTRVPMPIDGQPLVFFGLPAQWLTPLIPKA